MQFQPFFPVASYDDPGVRFDSFHADALPPNGCSFDNVILRRAFALTDTPFPVPYWNDRDVRTMVELGKSVGINPRFDIPFEGDMHIALSDARHQVKYVSAIWQRLTAN